MKKSDGIKFNDFMELDDYLFESKKDTEENENLMNKNYKKKTIYLIHYPEGKNVKYSLGVIRNIAEDGFNIRHLCNSQNGSSGGPLICLINFKIMGIHKGSKEGKNFNLRTLLNSPVEEFYEKDKLKKGEIFERGLNTAIDRLKTAQPFKIDYKKLTLNQASKKDIIKVDKEDDFYTIKDLSIMIKTARENALLGKYEESFEKYSLGILIIKYRIREIMNADKKL